MVPAQQPVWTQAATHPAAGPVSRPHAPQPPRCLPPVPPPVPPPPATCPQPAGSVAGGFGAAGGAAAGLAVPEPAADSAALGGRGDIAAEVARWLQGLAKLLAPPPAPGSPEKSISFFDMKRQHPVPHAVIAHYGTVSRFVRSVGCLHLSQDGSGRTLYKLSLQSQAHHELLLADNRLCPCAPTPGAPLAAMPPPARLAAMPLPAHLDSMLPAAAAAARSMAVPAPVAAADMPLLTLPVTPPAVPSVAVASAALTPDVAQ